MATLELYHYTTRKGAEGILESRVIRASSATRASSAPRDAMYGNGTYLTDKSPVTHTKFEIAHGNWDGGEPAAMRALKQGKTDFVFTIRIKRNAVQLVDSNRRIYLYPDYDLDLDDESVVREWAYASTDRYEREAYQHNVMQVSAGY